MTIQRNNTAWYNGERLFSSTGIMLYCLFLPVITFAQSSAPHTVTVVVQPITVMQVNVRAVFMAAAGAELAAGEEIMTAVDQSTTITWATNGALKKITVRTDIAGPKFVMMIVALNPTAGSAAAEFPVAGVDHDLLLSIGRSYGSSLVRYTGRALASQGIGEDVHSITFTVLSQ
jgi:hypothetical protein